MQSTPASRNAAGSGGNPRSATTGAGSVAMVKMNSEPVPGVLWTRIAPPMSSQRRWQIARPRPVPPYLRVVDESTWENALKSRPTRSTGMPMPVVAHGELEHHVRRIEGDRRLEAQRIRLTDDAPHLERDAAAGREFDRVVDEVDEHLPQTRDIAHDPRRHVARDVIDQIEFLR